MKKFLFLIAILVYHTYYSHSQSVNAKLNTDYYHLIERYEILNGRFSKYFHSTAKPFLKGDIAAFADQLLADSTIQGSRDRFNLQYLAIDNWKYSKNDLSGASKPFLKYFYRNKPDMYHLDIEDLDLHISPVVYFSAGKETAADDYLFKNTRGLELYGSIAHKLAFYTYATTTQERNPIHVRDYIDKYEAIPYNGFWKRYKGNGVDYFTANGYISFNAIKYVNVQFGHDKVFRGMGRRSMILSDFSNNYLFLKLNTKIWRINYTNVFAQLKADAFSNITGSIQGPYPNKYLAMHHLSYNVTDNFNLGLYEMVVIGDSTRNSFDVNYLNPIIFYRALEHQGGSSENALVAFDARWNIFKRISLYGQLTLDEFKIKELVSQSGWWGNKFGGQGVIKYIDAFGISNFDIHMEYNFARPYTYQHEDVYTNYAHYKQPLAHNLGANFQEFLSILRWQPVPRLNVVAQLGYSKYGLDTAKSNYGKEVMVPYTNVKSQYDNTIGQGVKEQVLYSSLCLSYQFRQNVFFDLNGMLRQVEGDSNYNIKENKVFSVSFRWNIPRTIHDF